MYVLINYGPHTSPSLQIQIAQIYNRSKLQTIPIIISKIHKQTNPVDCGVLAIANIVEFCFTGYLVQFDVDKIRPQFLKNQFLKNGIVVIVLT